MVAEVQCRIGQATAVFASLKWCLWKKAYITIATNMWLFRTLIIPILLYGSETLYPSEEGNQQTWGVSNAMSQANLGGNSARSTSKLNCTTTAIQRYTCSGLGACAKWTAPGCHINYSGADNHQHGRCTAVHRRGPGRSKLKTTLKGVVLHSRTPRPYPPITQHGNKLWKMLEVHRNLQQRMT